MNAHGAVSVSVRLEPSGRRFLMAPGDTVLAAALRAGISLEFGCANGSCGLCKARVVSGRARRVRFHDFVLSEAEKRQGHALLCCTGADSDLVVEASGAGGARDIARQRIEAKVRKLECHDDGVTILNLRTPRSRVLRFLAGQHVRLCLAGITSTEVSLANCPCDGMNLEFHLRAAALDASMRTLLAARKGERIAIDGPFGEFVLDEPARRPLLLLAYDTSFGPLRSLIEHAMNLELDVPMRLYRLGPWHGEPYLHNLCRSWSDAWEEFVYVTLEAGRETDWQQRLVARITGEAGALGEFDVYISGPAAFANPVAAALLAGGAREDHLWVSALEASRPMLEGPAADTGA